MKKGKKIWTIVAVCAFAGAVICILFMLGDYLSKKGAEKEYEAIAKMNEDDEKERQEIPENPSEETKKELEIPVDFVSLKEMNEDIYAWITIPGTQIDYPIVQSAEDNAYYLNHTAEKKESVNGAIFTENYNAKDFNDYITVLYGHNMRDGSMFAGLHQYEDRKYLEEHDELIIYMPDAILKYKIFAAYLTDNRHVLKYYNCGQDVDSRKAFVRDIMWQRTMEASVDSDAPVNEESKILTLSTCHSAGKNHRYLVQAYLEERIE